MVNALLLIGLLGAGPAEWPTIAAGEPARACVAQATPIAVGAGVVAPRRDDSVRSGRGCVGRLCFLFSAVTGTITPRFSGAFSARRPVFAYAADTLQTSRIRLQV